MTAETRRTPVRTCIGCRRRDEQRQLLRVVGIQVKANGSGTTQTSVQPDPDRVEHGRGAYVHATHECVQAAQQRRAFGRALRVSGMPDTHAVIGWIGHNAQKF